MPNLRWIPTNSNIFRYPIEIIGFLYKLQKKGIIAIRTKGMTRTHRERRFNRNYLKYLTYGVNTD